MSLDQTGKATVVGIFESTCGNVLQNTSAEKVFNGFLVAKPLQLKTVHMPFKVLKRLVNDNVNMINSLLK